MGQRVVFERLGEAEVRNPDMPVVVQQQIGRLDVAMHRAQVMSVLQGLGDLGTDASREATTIAIVAHRAGRLDNPGRVVAPHLTGGRFQIVHDGIQPAPVDELHGVVVKPVGITAIEDRHDVRVVQARRGLRFAPEPLELVAGEQARLRQHLQRHTASQRLLHGFEDHAHATAADLAHDAIVAEPLELGHGRTPLASRARLAIAASLLQHQQRRQQFQQSRTVVAMLGRERLRRHRFAIPKPGQKLLGQQIERVA